ncbi:MAG: hypothetical protein HY231_23715 [Acidobacteria bacterium]|nr:hypothetical protein [Acidobacteriota bacterium]
MSGQAKGKKHKPALLVSFVYVRNFLRFQDRLEYRDWVLDSGAYSAFNSGIEIRLSEYIQFAKSQRAKDGTLKEIFSLDVIGDYRAGLRNTEQMWSAGVEAIPCYHYGEPEWLLTELASSFPKIALGGCANVTVEQKIKWAAQCFARVWPKQIHGFGFGSDRFIKELPFHSVDSTSWCIAPLGFGKWRAFNYNALRSKSVTIRAEIDWYMKLEREMQARWKNAMREINASLPAIRLAVSGTTQIKYFRNA